MVRNSTLAGIAGLVLAAVALTVIHPSAPAADAADHGPGAKTDRAAFHDAMRKLWEDHIVWTRLYIVSAATQPAALADIGPTADRLLRNQADIGDALRPFYGDDAANSLTALLREHILTAARLIDAAKAGDTDAVTSKSTAWYANADAIAAALNALNPKHWPLDEMTAHMHDHLDLTLAEAVARIQGRYADDIAAYDRFMSKILRWPTC